jgi:hypothetical protein
VDDYSIDECACRDRCLTARDLWEESCRFVSGARPGIVLRGEMKELAVEARDDGVLAAAQPARASNDRVEHWLDVGRRARDDTKDLARRRLLFQRLAHLRVRLG